jgi:hypothetical protein
MSDYSNEVILSKLPFADIPTTRVLAGALRQKRLEYDAKYISPFDPNPP